MGLREKVLAAKDSRKEKVTVPEWDCDLFIAGWTGKDRAFVQAIEREKDRLFVVKMLSVSLVDEDGARLFTDKDLGELSGKDGKVLERLAVQAIEFNRLGNDAINDEKKDSEAIPN